MQFLPRGSRGNAPAAGSVVSSGFLRGNTPAGFYCGAVLSLPLCIFAGALFMRRRGGWSVDSVLLSLCNL